MMRYRTLALAALFACGAASTSAYAAGDAVHGKVVFARCAICHNADKNGPDGLGPNLFGVVGRKAANRDSFSYSAPLKAAGLTWSDSNLSKWVAGPARMVPGTKMAFPGITSKHDIADLVAYLDTLK